MSANFWTPCHPPLLPLTFAIVTITRFWVPPPVQTSFKYRPIRCVAATKKALDKISLVLTPILTLSNSIVHMYSKKL